ncbi:Serine threonine protein kinase-related domain containing protein [Aphelenchoides bicaudatus]|nr:Serine threonine protein kinase-related domain containing protein [Aphelenchoides bicaudatus]
MSSNNTVREIPRELNNFTDLKQIGEGTYGVVYRAKDKKNSITYALKRIKLNQDQEGIPSTCIREISILKDLNHTNIVHLHDVVLRHGLEIFLVFEFVDMDLSGLLKKFPNRQLPNDLTQSFMRQLLSALNYCHSLRVIHRDLKPSNILVMKTGVAKLADFGLARAVSVPSRCYTHEVVTLWYRPPELLLGGKYYSSALDIWSLGCIFGEMVRGGPLFEGNSEIHQLFRIFERLGTPDTLIWPGIEKLRDYTPLFPKFRRQLFRSFIAGLDTSGVDLLEKMILYPPAERITARAAMNHIYITNAKDLLPSVDKHLQLI